MARGRTRASPEPSKRKKRLLLQSVVEEIDRLIVRRFLRISFEKTIRAGFPKTDEFKFHFRSYRKNIKPLGFLGLRFAPWRENP
jgi:hypothetical protein